MSNASGSPSLTSAHLPAKLPSRCSISASAFQPNTRPPCSTSPTMATATMACFASVYPCANFSRCGMYLLIPRGGMAAAAVLDHCTALQRRGNAPRVLIDLPGLTSKLWGGAAPCKTGCGRPLLPLLRQLSQVLRPPLLLSRIVGAAAPQAAAAKAPTSACVQRQESDCLHCTTGL